MNDALSFHTFHKNVSFDPLGKSQLLRFSDLAGRLHIFPFKSFKCSDFQSSRLCFFPYSPQIVHFESSF